MAERRINLNRITGMLNNDEIAELVERLVTDEPRSSRRFKKFLERNKLKQQ